MTEKNTALNTTNESSVARQKSEARAAGLQSIRRDEDIILNRRESIKLSVVDIINAMYRQGIVLMELCGGEQITFGFIQPFQSELPWDFKTAKSRVAFTLNLPNGEIESFEELGIVAQREVLKQLELTAQGEHAGGLSNSRIQDKFTLFLNDLTKMKQELMKIHREKPLEERTPDDLRTFLADTQWLAEEREHALELLRR